MNRKFLSRTQSQRKPDLGAGIPALGTQFHTQPDPAPAAPNECDATLVEMADYLPIALPANDTRTDVLAAGPAG